MTGYFRNDNSRGVRSSRPPFTSRQQESTYRSGNLGLQDTASLLFFLSKLQRSVFLWKSILAVAVLVLIFLFAGSKSSLNDEGGKFGGLVPVDVLEIDNMNDVIVRVNISGEIYDDTYRDSTLRRLEEMSNVKGILFSINSPGGAAGSSEILYRLVKRISEKVPTVSSIRNLGASGAYYVAAGTGRIFAYEMSTVGSIGVVAGLFKFSDAMRKAGIGYESYRTSEFKAAPTPFEATSPAVKEYLRDILRDSHASFKAAVQHSRSLSDAELGNVSNGKVFNGVKALKLKLIDEIGSEHDALSYLRSKLGGLDDSKPIPMVEVSLERPQSPFDFARVASKVVSALKHSDSSESGVMAKM